MFAQGFVAASDPFISTMVVFFCSAMNFTARIFAPSNASNADVARGWSMSTSFDEQPKSNLAVDIMSNGKEAADFAGCGLELPQSNSAYLSLSANSDLANVHITP